MVGFPSAEMFREVPPGYIAQYVIDASVALKWVWAEEHGERARRYAQSAIEDTARLFVPSLFWYEIANALRYARAERGETSPCPPWDVFRNTPLHTVEFTLDAFPLVMAVAERHGITVYDASYVFLAQSLQVPLITADSQLARRCSDLPFVWSLDALGD